MAAVIDSIPLNRRGKFSKKLDELAQLVREHPDKLLLADTEPAVNFVLSKRYVANLSFGDLGWAHFKKKIPSVWSITITANSDFYRHPAWTQVDETEVDSMNSDR